MPSPVTTGRLPPSRAWPIPARSAPGPETTRPGRRRPAPGHSSRRQQRKPGERTSCRPEGLAASQKRHLPGPGTTGNAHTLHSSAAPAAGSVRIGLALPMSCRSRAAPSAYPARSARLPACSRNRPSSPGRRRAWFPAAPLSRSGVALAHAAGLRKAPRRRATRSSSTTATVADTITSAEFSGPNIPPVSQSGPA